EDAVEKAIIALPGMIDAQTFAIFLRTAHLAEGMILIPCDEMEFFRFRMEVEIKVLAGAEDSIEVGQENGDGHVAREGIDVDEIGEPGGKIIIGGFGHELAGLEDARD